MLENLNLTLKMILVSLLEKFDKTYFELFKL